MFAEISDFNHNGKNPIQFWGFKKDDIEAYKKENAIPMRKKSETRFLSLIC